MARQTVNSVTSAVTGELTSRVFSGLIRRYGKDAATREKLQRLEMLLIKIHSAVEASEKRTIENSWLLRWRDKLKEAASQGDEVLASFRPEDAQASSNTNNGNQQQGEAVSSSSSAPTTDAGALSFTRNSLSDMVQGICKVKNILFLSADDDMERLNRTLESLEKLSPDISEFIRLLHLEALPKVMLSQNRLQAAFCEICKAVELADSHYLEDLEWLAYWAGILREAKEQGRDVLSTTSACKTVNTENNEEPAVERGQEEDELSTLVHRLEGLARDVEYFSKLVYLCPAR